MGRPGQPSDLARLPGLLGRGVNAIRGGNILAGGVLANDLTGILVDEVLGFGEGAGDFARVGGVATLPGFIAAWGADRALDALSIHNDDVRRKVKQLAATGALAPIALPLVFGVQAVDELLGLLSGDLQAVFHDVFEEFDPTDPSTFVGGIVHDVGGLVETLGGGVGDAGKGIARAGQSVVTTVGGIFDGATSLDLGDPLAVARAVEEGRAVYGRPYERILEEAAERTEALNSRKFGSGTEEVFP
jgi:hypothetical protein